MGAGTSSQTALLKSRNVAHCGISLEAFKAFAETVPARLSTLEVVQQIIKPKSAKRRCRYVDLLPLDAVNTPTFYVSHTWRSNFLDVVEAITNYITHTAPKEQTRVFIWMDIFAINQHGGDSALDFMVYVRDATAVAQKLLFCMDSRGQILTRTWCLWEVWTAVNPNYPAVATPAKLAVLATKHVDWNAVREPYNFLDISRSETTVPLDHERIVTAISNSMGFDAVNTTVRSSLVESTRLEAEAAKRLLQTARPADAAALLRVRQDILAMLGQQDEAEVICKLRLDALKQAWGERDNLRVVQCMDTLALLLKEQRKFDEAEEVYRTALQMVTKAGVEWQVTVGMLNSLASIYELDAKAVDAEPLYRQVLNILEDNKGKDDEQYAATLNNLAGSLAAQGKNDEAEKLYDQALQVYKDTVGTDNAQTASCMTNLAAFLETQNKPMVAERFYREAAAIQLKTLGPLSVQLGFTLDKLAMILATRGVHDEAEELWRRALEINRKNLGDDHPLVALTMYNLATALVGQHKHGEAEKACRDALAAAQKARGPSHPSTIAAMLILADYLFAEGRQDEANTLYADAVELKRGSDKSLGKHSNRSSRS